jgi:hypothetical protein
MWNDFKEGMGNILLSAFIIIVKGIQRLFQGKSRI